MVNREQIYLTIYNNPTLQRSCKKLYKENASDAMHDLIMHISLLSDEKVLTLQKTDIIGYCRRILFNKMLHAKRKNSIFEEIIGDFEDYSEVIELNPETRKQIIQYITEEAERDSPHFYAPRIFLEYIKEGSMIKLAKATGIPKKAIFDTITKYKLKLKEKFECYPLHQINTNE